MTDTPALGSTPSNPTDAMDRLFKQYERPDLEDLSLLSSDHWVRKTFQMMLLEIEEGAIFSEEHKKRFQERFDPFQNLGHPIWLDLESPYMAGHWAALQHLHALAETYGSQFRRRSEEHSPSQQAKQSLWEDPIASVIDRHAHCSDAAKHILPMVEEGMPFTQDHYTAFIRKFSPLENPHHADWNHDGAGKVYGNINAVQLSHKKALAVADGLQQATCQAFKRLHSEALLRQSQDFARQEHSLSPRDENKGLPVRP